MFEFNPVGYVRNSRKEMYQVPYQVNVLEGMSAVIELEPGCNYEEALADLQGVERLWVVFVFHRAKTWKPKITPPRGGVKRSLFASRSPHRPNPIGISAVKLKSVKGLKLEIEDHDLVDGTPVLDIKPYIPYADSYPGAAAGWLDFVDSPQIFLIEESESAAEKLNWLEEQGVDLRSLTEVNLKLKPWPDKGNRIVQDDDGFEIAVKSWRLSFSVYEGRVLISDIYSGYAQEYLNGSKVSKWDDVLLHCKFNSRFK